MVVQIPRRVSEEAGCDEVSANVGVDELMNSATTAAVPKPSRAMLR
jgi:hypothetical protein